MTVADISTDSIFTGSVVQTRPTLTIICVDCTRLTRETCRIIHSLVKPISGSSKFVLFSLDF